MGDEDLLLAARSNVLIVLEQVQVVFRSISRNGRLSGASKAAELSFAFGIKSLFDQEVQFFGS